MITLLLLLSTFAQAAPRVNNGGGVWICESYGEVNWIQAADFFEPVGWNEKRSRQALPNLSTEEIFAQKVSFVNANLPELAALLNKYPVDFTKIIQWVPFPLSSTQDMNFQARPQPADCANEGTVHYEQLADFLYDNTLLITKPLWENPKLLPLDQAAIFFHEWIYKALRDDRDEQTSSRTRDIVAWLFSDAAPEVIEKEVSNVLSYSSRDQLEEELATFSVSPRCDAFVNGELVGAWQSHAGKFGEQIVIETKGLRFLATTSEKDGVPATLSIEAKGKSWKATLGEGVARAAYMRGKKVSLTHTQGSQVVTFSCWNQI